MDLTLCGDPADFLEIHRGKIALNVKVHSPYQLKKNTLEALSKLSKKQQEKILQFAEENVRENWWASMREFAKELDLGDIWCDGRSGGWLVFDMTYEKIVELIEESERECKHCKESYPHHLEGKCPFQATTFEATNTGPFETWEALRKFAAVVQESLKTVVNDLDPEVQFLLEHLDDEYTTLAPAGQGTGSGTGEGTEGAEGTEEDEEG